VNSSTLEKTHVQGCINTLRSFRVQENGENFMTSQAYFRFSVRTLFRGLSQLHSYLVILPVIYFSLDIAILLTRTTGGLYI